MLEYFLQSGHDIYTKNYRGENAYMLAEIYGRLKTSNYLENKVLYLGHSKICSICYKSKDDKFITCKNNHIVHLKCQQQKNRHRCLMCSFRYVI